MVTGIILIVMVGIVAVTVIVIPTAARTAFMNILFPSCASREKTGRGEGASRA